MDKLQILIITVGTIIIILFSAYTYSGPIIVSQKAGTNVEPVKITESNKFLTNKVSSSLNGRIDQLATVTSKNHVTQSNYENKEMPENYYSITFPSEYVVKHKDKPGSLTSDLTNAQFTVNLQDIPDDSTLELYVLTTIEPDLNSSHAHYQRTNFETLNINNSKALELSYTWENLTKPMKSIKIFIEGQDQAAVITFTAPRAEYANYNSTVNSVLYSFRWI
jgi:hypothetical protein